MLPWCKQSCTQCVIFVRLFSPLLPYAAFFTHESHGGLRQDRSCSQWTCPHTHSVSRASGGYYVWHFIHMEHWTFLLQMGCNLSQEWHTWKTLWTDRGCQCCYAQFYLWYILLQLHESFMVIKSSIQGDSKIEASIVMHKIRL